MEIIRNGRTLQCDCGRKHCLLEDNNGKFFYCSGDRINEEGEHQRSQKKLLRSTKMVCVETV